MKKAIWVVIALILAVFFGNNYLENKAEKERKRAERQSYESAIKAGVENMIARRGAIADWVELLSTDEKIRMEPVLTVELERVWLRPEPIMYIGSIKDIETKDESNYMVSFERNLYGSFEYMFLGTELELKLECKKQDIDLFLKKHPALFKEHGFNNGVAVIANIDEIYASELLGEEGERIDVKTGIGSCVEILFSGDVQL